MSRAQRQSRRELRFERLEKRQLLAANVLIVADPADFGGQSNADGLALENFLTSQGHIIDDHSGPFTNTVPTTEQLADVDVIVVSRAARSSNYDSMATQWNALATPIVVMNEYISRSSHWGLINTGSISGG